MHKGSTFFSSELKRENAARIEELERSFKSTEHELSVRGLCDVNYS